MDFGLIAIHYRQPSAIVGLLDHMLGWTVRPEHVVVVDNSAIEEPVGPVIAGLGGSTEPIVLEATANLGYAGAANLGIERLRDLGLRYALILTQEARLTQDAAQLLVQAILDTPKAAVAGPVLEFSSAPGTVFSAGGVLRRDGTTIQLEQGSARGSVELGVRPYDVDWVDGAVMLVDLDASAEVGDLDPSYFLYVEEIDLQYALRRAGYRVLLVPKATGYQEPGNYRTYLRFRNNRYFTKKYRDDLQPWPWRRQIARDVARRLTGRIDRLDVRSAVRGVHDSATARMGNPATPAERVTIMVEFEPDELHTGVAGRLRHLLAHYPDATVTWVHSGPRKNVSLRQRLAAVRTTPAPTDTDEILIEALGSPPMMHLARRFSRLGLPVRLDVCDSCLDQWDARVAAPKANGGAKLLSVAAWMLLLHAASPTMATCYISERDVTGDHRLNAFRDVQVIPAVAPSNLASLDSFSWPAERVVLAGDFQSFHNASGLELLLSAVDGADFDLPVLLYGPEPPARPLPAQVKFAGWATPYELLSGNTVAFISNRAGSGTPNKLCEAILAGRPMIIHEEMRPIVAEVCGDLPVTAFWYDDVTSLRAALESVDKQSTVGALLS